MKKRASRTGPSLPQGVGEKQEWMAGAGMFPPVFLFSKVGLQARLQKTVSTVRPTVHTLAGLVRLGWGR